MTIVDVADCLTFEPVTSISCGPGSDLRFK